MAMANTESWLDLIAPLLPSDMSVNELKNAVAEDLWQADPKEALAKALRDCGRIDWSAYMDANPDVKDAGCDPVWHFIRNGIFEGRALFSNPVGWTSVIGMGPKISVIVYCHNTSASLRECLNSLIAQTLANVEYIIVDDHSNDVSSGIITAFAARDSRIRPIFFRKKIGMHMALKAGVEAANGDYIMFLPADGILARDACGNALEIIGHGYDIVFFGVGENKDNGEPDAIAEVRPLVGSSVILRDVVNTKGDIDIYNKIFRANVCKIGFGLTEDGIFPKFSGMYQLIAIASTSRTALKSDDNLYMQLKYSDIENVVANNNIKSLIKSFDIIDPITKLCLAKDIPYVLEKIKERIFEEQAASIIQNIDTDKICAYFDKSIDSYGVEFTILGLMKKYLNKQSYIIDKIINYSRTNNFKQIKNIAFLYIGLYHGGSERVMKDQTTALIDAGYNVHVILEQKFNHGIYPDERVHLHYISPSMPYTYANMKCRIQDLYKVVKEQQIDLVIHVTLVFPGLAWELILERMLGINSIGYQHSDPAFVLGTAGTDFPFQDRIKAQTLADKVVCLSRASESALRTLGVDAVYVPNGVEAPTSYRPKTAGSPTLALIGRLDSPQKQVKDALRVLTEARKSRPDLKLLCIGGFDDSKNENKFFELVRKSGLSDSVHVAGWTDAVASFLEQARILLAVSWWEAFPMALLEAQASGLPCVMYELALEQAKNNPSIISVPHGDWRAAASEIVRLLNEPDRYQKLSLIAREAASRYSSVRFADNTVRLVRNFRLFSPIRRDAARHCKTFLKWVSFYCGRAIPS